MHKKMLCRILLRRMVFAAVFALSAAPAVLAADMIANTPYADGLGGTSSGVYRIPAMAKSTNGVAVAVYDCRYNSSGDLPNAIDIAENWSGDNGATWSAPRVAVDVPNTNNNEKACNIGDPCIVYDPAGDRFWLMAITGGGLFTSHDADGNSIADVVLYTRGTGESDKWQEWTGGPEGGRRSVKQMILDSLAAAAFGEGRWRRNVKWKPNHLQFDLQVKTTTRRSSGKAARQAAAFRGRAQRNDSATEYPIFRRAPVNCKRNETPRRKFF